MTSDYPGLRPSGSVVVTALDQDAALDAGSGPDQSDQVGLNHTAV